MSDDSDTLIELRAARAAMLAPHASAGAKQGACDMNDRTRRDRLDAFRRSSGGTFTTALLPAAEHRGPAAVAVSNWFLSEAFRRPVCFVCRCAFDTKRRPAAFLTASSDLAPEAVAVAAICTICAIELTPETIENAALETLRKDLRVRGGFVD